MELEDVLKLKFLLVAHILISFLMEFVYRIVLLPHMLIAIFESVHLAHLIASHVFPTLSAMPAVQDITLTMVSASLQLLHAPVDNSDIMELAILHAQLEPAQLVFIVKEFVLLDLGHTMEDVIDNVLLIIPLLMLVLMLVLLELPFQMEFVQLDLNLAQVVNITMLTLDLVLLALILAHNVHLLLLIVLLVQLDSLSVKDFVFLIITIVEMENIKIYQVHVNLVHLNVLLVLVLHHVQHVHLDTISTDLIVQ